jgi:alkaline phosphatase D
VAGDDLFPPFGRRTLLKWGGLSATATAVGCVDASAVPERCEADLASTAPACAELTLAPTRFPYSVAAADPTTEALTFWTRIAGASGPEEVRLVVAYGPDLEGVVATELALAEAAHDFTVELRVEGLEAGRDHFYAFEVAAERSPIGHARTAPTSGPVRLAFTCCASYAHGFFHTYRRIAEREDLDAVVHLGDYIYEYADGVYGDVRGYDPPHECLSLDDYRRRYAHYRRDADLVSVHQAHAVVVTWDDHELANNAWLGGSIEHGPGEGTWAARRAAATQAHREWLPRHEPFAGSLYRQLVFGDVELFVLDTRLEGRDPPPQSDADAARPGRTLLGAAQREAFLTGLRTSQARWKVVAQSVQMSPHHHDFWNHDAWDGFGDERRRILETIRDEGIENVFFVCGDGHKSFADDLPVDPFDASVYDPATGVGSIATELMTPPVSSPHLFGAQARGEEARVLRQSPHTKLVDAEARGYWLVELDEARARAELWHVPDVEDPSGGVERRAAVFEVRDGEGRLRRVPD